MDSPSRELQAFLFTDPLAFAEMVFTEVEPGVEFQPAWFHEAFAHAFQEIRSGRRRRQIVNVPPRSGKSIFWSIAFPMFLLGHDPSIRIICVSYSKELAQDFALKRKAVAETRWYKELFPAVRLRRSPVLDLRTSEHGRILGAGVGGGVLGRGADLIFADDVQKIEEAHSEAHRARLNSFFDHTLMTRLNDKLRGGVVIIQQRIHEDDLTGHVLATNPEDWKVLSLPAIAETETTVRLSRRRGDVLVRKPGDLLQPAREPMALLEKERRRLGTYGFSALYQQAPAPKVGLVVKREWLRFYQRLEDWDRIIVSWDTASSLDESSCYSVGTVWAEAGSNVYLLDVLRGRWEFPDLKRKVLWAHREYKAAKTLIEDADIGRALNQQLRQEGLFETQLVKPRLDKVARFDAQSARFEAGLVRLPAQGAVAAEYVIEEHRFITDYIAEILGFPGTRHSDQVDSTSQALDYIWARRAPFERAARPRLSIAERQRAGLIPTR